MIIVIDIIKNIIPLINKPNYPIILNGKNGCKKINPRELSEKRKIAIKLREKGVPNKEVAEIVGISAMNQIRKKQEEVANFFKHVGKLIKVVEIK